MHISIKHIQKQKYRTTDYGLHMNPLHVKTKKMKGRGSCIIPGHAAFITWKNISIVTAYGSYSIPVNVHNIISRDLD